MLRTPNLKPYIIYAKAPPFTRLKETRHQAFARSTFDETSSRSFTVGLNTKQSNKILYGKDPDLRPTVYIIEHIDMT